MEGSSGATFSLLFTAALCLEAPLIDLFVYCPAEKVTWTEARRYCRTHYHDLVPWSVVTKARVRRFLIEKDAHEVWIGLHRDAASAWKWADAEGLSGADLSQSGDLCDGGQSGQSGHCALMREDGQWYSVNCCDRYDAYCSAWGGISHYEVATTWHEASLYCKTQKGQLATVSADDQGGFDHIGWIGLHSQAGHVWSWADNSTSKYRNWAAGEPRAADCGSFRAKTGRWRGKVCSRELQPLCYRDNLVVVKENKTWEEALRHCSGIEGAKHRFLNMCYMKEDTYNYIRRRIYGATTDEVWVGLRFLGGEWWWVNGATLDDQVKLPQCPSRGTHCGTLSKYASDKWMARDCSERRNFICREIVDTG